MSGEYKKSLISYLLFTQLSSSYNREYPLTQNFPSYTGLWQSYHRPVVALPNGSGRRKDGHLWKGKWASVNGKTCICGREDKTLFSSYNPNYLLFPIWQFCQIDYSPWEILSTPLLLYIYTRTHTRERKANRIVWVFYKSACLFQKKSAILTIITLILYNHTT